MAPAAPVIITAALVAVVFLGWALLRHPRVAPEELGLAPRFVTSCTVSLKHLGILGHASSLSVRVAIYDGFLVLGFFSKPVVIRFGDIEDIQIRPGLFGSRKLLISTSFGYKYQLSVQDPDAIALLLRKGEDVEASWTSSMCKEKNPKNFDICWNCERPRDGV